MQDTDTLYPLLFEPIYKKKVWGGRAMERLGRDLPGSADTPIGESWELVDLEQTSASGGGGSAEHSVVSNGPLTGARINQLIASHGRAVLGSSATTAEGVSGGGGFPLLIKYLDANTNLSVQVHPSPDYAASHPESHLKSEAWYVVDCEPGAVIYKGLRPGVTAERLREALKANTDAAVVPLLHTVPVKPGDCHYLPSGTCHALGAGVLVAEVQTPSDTTFRVYDWGRPRSDGRELHIEQAIACIDFDNPATDGPNAWELNETRDENGAAVTRLVRCPFFQIELVEAPTAYSHPFRVGLPEVWMVLSGEVDLAPGSGQAVRATQGQTLLLTAGMGALSAEASSAATWLRVTAGEPAAG